MKWIGHTWGSLQSKFSPINDLRGANSSQRAQRDVGRRLLEISTHIEPSHHTCILQTQVQFRANLSYHIYDTHCNM